VRNRELDDPVLVRTSGTPTFYLASTVDDTCDGITHLVRADPLRPSTAKQIHIWRCLGAEPPVVGHVALVMGADNDPLRIGATSFTIRGLRERGISPIAVLMYLAMPEAASWKPPPTCLNEIVQRVDVHRLPRRPITFDLQALERLHRRLATARATPAWQGPR
jgi:glutamyl-tRNA synthetase